MCLAQSRSLLKQSIESHMSDQSQSLIKQSIESHMSDQSQSSLPSYNRLLCGKACRIAAPGHGLASPSSVQKSIATQLLPVTPFGDFTSPAARIIHVHVDLVGTLPTSAGYTYYLTAVDRFMRWPEVVPIPGITSNTVARALITRWISYFGCPQTITSDQGRQFESHLFRSLVQLCGIQLSRAAAYHPAANGLVERFHRSLKDGHGT
jgi:transposase InsO family protein